MTERDYFEEVSKKSSRKKGGLQKELKACFGGDAHVQECCRIYTRAELAKMNRGVAQRGEAIRRFLEDHLSGERRYLKSKLMPASVAQRIFARNIFPLGSGTQINHQLQFFYGPDIIRDPEGNFRVLEDNVGYVGGFGDLNAFRKAADIISGKQTPIINDDPFYGKMAAHFERQAMLYGSGKVLLLSYPRMHRSNREDQRLAKILKRFGIQEITSTDRLKIKDSQLFHQDERVSFLIANVVLENIEEYSPENSIQFFKSSVSGFWSAYKSGGFGLSSHPASECASDKEFYMYVERMIQFYLEEIPILQNIFTQSLCSAKSRSIVFLNLANWVIKSTIGQGGSKVWIGKTLSPLRAKRLRVRVKASPGNFIAQAYTELSRLNEYSVDARPLSIISAKKALVSKRPWGRGALASKPQKVNLCSGGLFVISDT